MSVELAERISRKGSGMRIRLFQRPPVPVAARDGRAEGRVPAGALASGCAAAPDHPYYRLEDLQGRRSLRYATASRMDKRCLDCHNKMEESPKRDWKEGDVVGVYEVSFPVAR